MKIMTIQCELLDFGRKGGLTIGLLNGKRHSIKFDMTNLDSEELPELLLSIGKKLREWARTQEPPKP